MPIPTFQALMLPLLRVVGDEREHTPAETVDALAAEFCLTDEEKKALLPSGSQGIFTNRVAWAKAHLKMAGILEQTRRGVFRITPRGLDILRSNPHDINMKFLGQFPEYANAKSKKGKFVDDLDENGNNHQGTPEETIENAFEKIRDDLASDLLQRLKSCSPSFFERLVVEVIVKMGYGGTLQDAGRAIGKSGDGGIDGIIKEDKLGLDVIYIQAKRWENTVGRPEIQRFVGALTGMRANKGLFITTSCFSSDATDYASRIDAKVVLINGETLAQLMIDHNVGVSITATYALKKVDSDYFTEE